MNFTPEEWARFRAEAEDPWTDALEYRARAFLDQLPDTLPRPDVGSCGESIDLWWDASGYTLLVNVPANPLDPITWYGDDGYGNHAIRNGVSRQELVDWLAARVNAAREREPEPSASLGTSSPG